MSTHAIAQLLNRYVRIILNRTSHPGNIGAAARAMKTMGLARLYLVDPLHFPHPEADARAVGAVDVIRSATVCGNLDEALSGVVHAYALSARRRDLGPVRQSPRQAAQETVAALLDRGPGFEVALVFGNETSGLTNAEVQRCDRIVEIPSDPAFPSLNLGAAVQLLCYELRVAGMTVQEGPGDVSRVTPYFSMPATHDDIERFYEHLQRVLVEVGFHDPKRPRRLMAKLRRLFGRAGLERDETEILRGILTAIEDRLRD